MKLLYSAIFDSPKHRVILKIYLYRVRQPPKYNYWQEIYRKGSVKFRGYSLQRITSLTEVWILSMNL